MDTQGKKLFDATNRIAEALNGNQEQIERIERLIAEGVVDPETLVECVSSMQEEFECSWPRIVYAFHQHGIEAERFVKMVGDAGMIDSLFDFAQYVFVAGFSSAFDRYSKNKK
jgi:hypothetical protein